MDHQDGYARIDLACLTAGLAGITTALAAAATHRRSPWVLLVGTALTAVVFLAFMLIGSLTERLTTRPPWHTSRDPARARMINHQGEARGGHHG